MFRWGRVLGIFSLFITSVPSFRLRVAFFFYYFSLLLFSSAGHMGLILYWWS